MGWSHENLLEIWKAMELGRSFYICKVSARPQIQLRLVTNLLMVAFGGGAAAGHSDSSLPTTFLSASLRLGPGVFLAWRRKGLSFSGHSYNQGLEW